MKLKIFLAALFSALTYLASELFYSYLWYWSKGYFLNDITTDWIIDTLLGLLVGFIPLTLQVFIYHKLSQLWIQKGKSISRSFKIGIIVYTVVTTNIRLVWKTITTDYNSEVFETPDLINYLVFVPLMWYFIFIPTEESILKLNPKDPNLVEF